MKVFCTQENLRAGLQITGRIISPSKAIPALNNVLLIAENGSLSVKAANLELGLLVDIRCRVEEDGQVVIPAKTLLELISTLPNKTLELSVVGKDLVIETEKYKTVIKGVDASESPVLPEMVEGGGFTVPVTELKQALDEVLFATSLSETQAEIAGVYMYAQSDKAIVMVGTDRYRLAERVLPITASQQSITEEGVILPHRTAIELSRILSGATGDIRIMLSVGQASCVMEGIRVVSRLIDGQYPEYKHIIPKDFETEVVVDRQGLLSALKTTSVFAGNAQSIRLTFATEGGVIKVASGAQASGESEIEVDAQISGADQEVLFNYRYVLDCLQIITDERVVFKLVNPLSAVVLVPEGKDNYLYLVMPIRT
jgi:DNA polymerase III subunit beta